VQHDKCAAVWCSFRDFMGITSTAVECPSLVDVTDGGGGGGGGCCDVSDPGSIFVGLIAIAILRRRRRH
jgi:hypothetical protein